MVWLADDAPAYCCPCGTPCASAQNSTMASAGRLANGGPCGATHGCADHGTVVPPAMGADRGTRRAANGAANHGTLASAHRLSQYRTCSCTDATAEQGSDVVGMGGGSQCSQNDNAAGRQRGETLAGSRGARGKFQHGWWVGLGPYRQTWRFVIN